MDINDVERLKVVVEDVGYTETGIRNIDTMLSEEIWDIVLTAGHKEITVVPEMILEDTKEINKEFIAFIRKIRKMYINQLEIYNKRLKEEMRNFASIEKIKE